MRSKFVNHLLLLSNVLFVLGLTITTILINKSNISSNSITQINSVNMYYLPYTIFMLMSLLCAILFAYFRKEYFVLISMYLTKKSIFLFKFSVIMLFLNIFISDILVFAGIALVNSDNPANIDFFKDAYLFIVLSIVMFLTFVDVIIDALSKLKIKVDLANRRSEFFDELENKNDGKQ